MTDLAEKRHVTLVSLLRRNTDYRSVYVAQAVSQGGDWFAMVPLITLLHQLTGQGALGALLMAAETLVIAAISPIAGPLVDRIDRRTLLITCQLGSAAAVLLLLCVRSSDTAWIAVVTYTALAASKAFFAPAISAILPRIVGAGELLTANAGISSLWGVMLALGATLGGIAAAVTSPAVCFVVDSLTFVLSAALLSRIHRGRLAHTGGTAALSRGQGHGIRQVVELCKADRRVLTLMLAKPGSHLGNGAIALFPAVAAGLLHVDSVGASLLFAARGIGALLGPLVAQRLMRAAGNLRATIAAAIALYGLGYLAFTVVGSLPLAIVFVVLAHIGGSMNACLTGFGLQVMVPDEIRGRTFAIDNMFAMSAIAASQFTVAIAAFALDAAVLTRVLAVLVLTYAVVWWLAARHLGPPVASENAAQVPERSA